MPVFLIGKTYWRNYLKLMERAVDLKYADAKTLKYFKLTDDIREVVKAANKIGHPKVSENYYDGFREASTVTRINNHNAAAKTA